MDSRPLQSMRLRLLVAILLPVLAIAQDYSANLSPNAVVPPANSRATGNVTFHFNRKTISDSTADYVITLNTPTGARSVELHQGGLGQNGDLIVTIWDASDKGAVIDQPLQGVIKRDTLTRSQLVGPFKGKSINSLQDSVDSGNVYVLVTSKQYPNGELRAQLR